MVLALWLAIPVAVALSQCGGSIGLSRDALTSTAIRAASAVILYSAAEELLFRGMVTNWVSLNTRKVVVLLFLGSACFAAIHFGHVLHSKSPLHLMYFMSAGFVLQLARLAQGGLLGCMLAHALYNLLMGHLGDTIRNGYGAGAALRFLEVVQLGTVCLAATLALGVYLWGRARLLGVSS